MKGESPLATRSGSPRIAELEGLLGDFLVEEEIARTPRAMIYRIRSQGRAEKPLALKVALQEVHDEDLVRFQHEVRLLSEARHRNVIEVYDFGVLPGSFPFLTMELLADDDVAQTVQEGDWDLFYSLAMQAAAGLAHIHRQGIVHLDVKPANLGLGAGDRLNLKIMDFGLAQNVRGPLDRKIRGTLAYTAPEVLLQDRYDHRADLYSLGMTLFQLATGVLPSAGDDEASIRFHLEGELPDPQAYRSDMPSQLAEILRRLLSRDPHERGPSAGKLLLDFARAAGREIDPAGMALGEGRILSSRMVGRSEHSERLVKELELQDSCGSVVLIEGSEGVGKSRLLREFRLTAAMQGARVGMGRAIVNRPEPLRPVLEALRHLGVDLEETSQPLEEGEPYLWFSRVAQAIELLAREASAVVLILDDLQYAGEATRELLNWIATDFSSGRVLVLGGRRTEESKETEEESIDSWDLPDVDHLVVQPLDEEACRELVDSSLGTRGLPDTMYGWIFEHSEGYPGRVQQLIQHLVQERVLRFRQGEWKPSLPSLSRLAARPESLRILDRERIAALPSYSGAVLAALAVVNSPVSWREIAEVVEQPDEDTYRSLKDLVDFGFVEVSRVDQEQEYAFARPALARAVYEDMRVERRQELHRIWAVRLQETTANGESDRAIAEHLWQGGDRLASRPFVERSSQQALHSFSFRDAAELFARLAELAREQGDEEEATSALLQQAGALDSSGATAQALGLYRGLLDRPSLLRRVEDRRRRAEICLGAARLHGKLSEFDEQHRMAEEGLAVGLEESSADLISGLLEAKADALLGLRDLEGAFGTARKGLKLATRHQLSRSRGALLDTLGRIERQQGAWRKARFLFRRGLDAAIEVGDDRLVAQVRHDLSELERSGGEWLEARSGYEANLEAARRLHDPWIELDSLHALAALDCRRGDWKSARQPLQKSLDLRRRLGTREGQTEAWLLMGKIDEMLGDWAQAERHLRRVLKVLSSETASLDRTSAETQLASLARKRGSWGKAEELARTALSSAESLGDRRLLALCHHQLGLVEKDRGHWAPAAAHLQRAYEVGMEARLADLEPQLLNSLSDLAIRRGETDEARELVVDAMRTAKALDLQIEMAKANIGTARLAVSDRQKGGGDSEFAEAVRAFSEHEVPFEYARALFEWGVRTRDSQLAVDRLDRALVAFERLGAATDFERTRGVIDGIRERNFLESSPPRSAPGIWEVARLVNSTLDLQEVLETTMDLVLQRLQAERGMVVLVGRISKDLEVAVSRNLDSATNEEANLSETVVRQVIEDHQPILSVDAMTDPRFGGSESIVAAHIVSLLCVPLIIREQLAGAIYIDHRSSHHLFGPRDLEFLVAFADQAAIAIENARLFGELEERRRKLKVENEALRREIVTSRSLGSLIGRSRVIDQLKETLERVALSQTTILIRGESGTGKGLVARILHSASARREGPFVHFNCAALPETLVESELFGHEKGAFTGAISRKPGRFELAEGGTIFLDEIGKISRSVQAKLLRVVEDRRFERVGGTRTLDADVRIVAATNLNLEEAIGTGEFREDLYYRLNIIPIILPPLRERKEDIPYLVEHFFNKIRKDLGQDRRELDPAVLDLFFAYRWPGNIRELEAAVHRALVLSRGEVIGVEDFAWLGGGTLVPLPSRSFLPAPGATGLEEGNYQELTERFDRELVEQALEVCSGKIREAARYLGIARNTLKAKLRKYGLGTDGSGESNGAAN